MLHVPTCTRIRGVKWGFRLASLEIRPVCPSAKHHTLFPFRTRHYRLSGSFTRWLCHYRVTRMARIQGCFAEELPIILRNDKAEAIRGRVCHLEAAATLAIPVSACKLLLLVWYSLVASLRLRCHTKHPRLFPPIFSPARETRLLVSEEFGSWCCWKAETICLPIQQSPGRHG
jgi:hypothetical protein